ncbi:MAG: TetR/AcrR family transcriptional regulator [Myxococcota bacterium]
MPRPPARATDRWSRRRAEILAAAETVFGEKGLLAARLEDVAARLGMRRPSLVYYFGDKDALYDAVFAGILDALRARIEAAREGDDALLRMEAIAGAWVDYLHERPHAARILLHQIVDDLPPRGREVRGRAAALLAAIGEEIDEGVATGRIKPIDARSWATAIAGASMFWVSAQPAVQRSLGFDTLAPEPLERFREMLVVLTRQLLAGRADGPASARAPVAATSATSAHRSPSKGTTPGTTGGGRGTGRGPRQAEPRKPRRAASADRSSNPNRSRS